jgi:4-amino-4-deoxy-L-arabinose transferase-like glycosyltransferase
LNFDTITYPCDTRVDQKLDALSLKARWSIAAIATLIWFSFLGYRDLVEPDEGRYAEIPREMVGSGDWLTPRLNGYKYFEKPALQYWATAISYTLFGESNATARLWVAVIGFVGALCAWFINARLFGTRAGFLAFLVLTSMLFYVALGHLLTLDMSVSVFMFLGIGALLVAQSRRGEPTQVRRWMLIGWGMLGCATLSKGLMGIVLPGGAVLLYMLWQRDWALLRHLHLGTGLLTFLAVTAPWFIVVSIANPEFAQFFFIHEHFARYSTDVHGHAQPFWFFLPVLAGGVLPWLGGLVRALLRPGFHWWPEPGQGFDPMRLLWTYVAFIFVFFSLSQSKLHAYILPMFPALALIIGRQLAEHASVRVEILGMALGGVLALSAAALLHLGASQNTPVEVLHNYQPWLIAAGLLLLGGALAAYGMARKKRVYALTAVALLSLLAFQTASLGYQSINQTRSSRELANAIRPLLNPDSPVFSVQGYPQSLPFYLGKTLTLVRYEGELAMGIRQEPRDIIHSWKDFRARWIAADRAVAVFNTRDLEHVNLADFPGHIVYRDPRKTVLSKR